MELERQKIVEALDRITASEGFRGKPVMKRLLSYLVTECLDGRSEQIKGYSIGVDVFDQAGNFDPDHGARVRNNAVRLRGLLKTYYLGEGKDDPIHIEIPKGSYVPWFTDNNISGSTNKSAVRSVPAYDPRPGTIAVLPFKNLSNDPELSSLAHGFSLALSDALTKFEDVQVIGVSHSIEGGASADEFRSKEIDFLIDGEVQLFRKAVKISLRLIHSADRSHLWSDSLIFDGEQDDLFDVQERVSERIASHVGGEFGHINNFRYQSLVHSRPSSLQEQDILLKHYHHTTVLSTESREKFYREVMAALKQNPDSAMLNAIAGGLYGEVWAAAVPNADQALQKFARLTEKAYTLNPRHQIVVTTLGFKCLAFNDRDRFFNLFEESKDWIAYSPLRMGAWAMHICMFGEWELGKQLLNRVFESSLHVPMWLHGINCLYYYRLADYETALVEANRNRIPGLFWGPFYRTAILARLGRIVEAQEEFERLLECRPDFEQKGRRLVSSYIKEDSLLDSLFDDFASMGKDVAA